MGALGFPLNFPEVSKKKEKTDSAAFPGSLCHSHRYRCVLVLALMRWMRTGAAGEVLEPRTIPRGSWASDFCPQVIAEGSEWGGDRTPPRLPSRTGPGPHHSSLG